MRLEQYLALLNAPVHLDFHAGPACAQDWATRLTHAPAKLVKHDQDTKRDEGTQDYETVAGARCKH
jgi:hypothetical protein